MELVKCKKCGQLVYTTAETCLNCGEKVERTEKHTMYKLMDVVAKMLGVVVGVALCFMVVSLWEGRGLTGYLKKGYWEEIEESAEKGNSEAQYTLAQHYADKEKAFYWYRKAAENGNIEAEYEIGRCYDEGIGVEESYTKAILWYWTAAEKGNISAQYAIGAYYGDKRILDIIELHDAAVYGGDVVEHFNKSMRYYNSGDSVPMELGFGLTQMVFHRDSVDLAIKWLRLAADQGLAEAQFTLGNFYYTGERNYNRYFTKDVIKQDYEKAFEWWTKAAEQGLASAQYNLGICYENGEGVEQDIDKAVKWWTKAAEQGLADAQCNLGICYAIGKGVEKDKKEAIKWCRKAAEQGDENAKKALERLQTQ